MLNTLLIATLFFSLTLASCAELDKGVISIGSLFKGNTRKTINDYSLEEKTEYRKYKFMNRVKKREADQQIMSHMEDEGKDKGKKKAKIRAIQVKEKRNLWQKILKK